jgi:molybdenum cofactor cytidylyltransferase
MPRRDEALMSGIPRMAGVILAAGASRRMGRNKMLLSLEGESLVRRATKRALGAGLDSVVVVVGHEPDRVRAEIADLPVDVALNADYEGPTSGSLHRGLQQLAPEVSGAVVMLADMVHVTQAMLSALVEGAVRSTAPLVVSRYGDVTAPPLLFRRVLFPELLEWTGEGCGKAVVKRHLGEAVVLDWPSASLTDVDTPEDFEAAALLFDGPKG